MQISLVFPPFFLDSLYNLPPLGLINLASMLKDTEHEVKIHDFVLEIRRGNLKMSNGIYDDCAAILLAAEPDIIAFSAQCVSYPSVIQIARRIKQNQPNVRLVIGGHNSAFLDKERA